MEHKLILGTVQFGLDYGVNNTAGKVNSRNVKVILDAAFEKGVLLLDSAEGYGDSQEKIGEYHINSSNSFQVITKFSSTRLDLPANIKERVYKNLKTLNIKSLYSYMFHSFDDYNKFYPVFKEDLIFLREEKSIQKIGVSLYTNEELEEVLKNDNIDLVQLPFNLFDNSSRRKEILLKAKSKGLEIHVRSTFLQGLFFKNVNSIQGKILPLKTYLEDLEQIKNKYKVSTETLALQYALQKSYIDKVLIGVDSAEQLKKNIYICSEKTDIPTKVIDNINIKEGSLLNPINWI